MDKRNADKDREMLSFLDRHQLQDESERAWSHWLERAVSAEQRVAELEKHIELLERKGFV